MSRFKTELCNNLMELGSCKYGDRCHYAHGAHELRQVSRRHPKYRTEKCKNFELTGKCPFGPRCSYVHPRPDLDSMIEQLTRYVQHTKAPKPDSEDDDDETNLTSIFSRTTTSSSLLSQSESSSISSHSNQQFFIDNANKENQLVADFTYNSSTPMVEDNFKKLVGNKFNYSENPFMFSNQQPSILETHKPLTTITHNQQESQQQQQPQPQLASSTTLTIQRPQQPQRFAMRALSSNSQSQPQDHTEATKNYINSSSPLSTSSSSSFDKTITTGNPFSIHNPFSDYFNHTSNITEESSSLPNKQFYTRF